MAETAKSTRRTQATTTAPGSSGQPPQTRVVESKTTTGPAKPQDVVVETKAPPVEPPTKKEPTPSVRRNVSLNATTVARAFQAFTSSRSVRYVQVALSERGFPSDDDRGVVTFDTRAQYAEYQRSIDETPTGIPTAYSLNLLGFDVIG